MIRKTTAFRKSQVPGHPEKITVVYFLGILVYKCITRKMLEGDIKKYIKKTKA